MPLLATLAANLSMSGEVALMLLVPLPALTQRLALAFEMMMLSFVLFVVLDEEEEEWGALCSEEGIIELVAIA